MHHQDSDECVRHRASETAAPGALIKVTALVLSMLFSWRMLSKQFLVSYLGTRGFLPLNSAHEGAAEPRNAPRES